ncbi:MAG: GntR family transcriptional regulator [Slackia sp.]|nr:GntR family transcriptional regulator [Slackia sp.]
MMDSLSRYGVKVEFEKAHNESRLRISIDDESGIPIWLQLRNRLIYLIVSGAIAPNEKLPTVREMAVELGINYNTVSKVYQDIERDGYIVSKRGKGTFVSDASTQEKEALEGGIEYLVDDFIRQCREFGVPRQEIAGLVEKRLGESGLFDR